MIPSSALFTYHYARHFPVSRYIIIIFNKSVCHLIVGPNIVNYFPAAHPGWPSPCQHEAKEASICYFSCSWDLKSICYRSATCLPQVQEWAHLRWNKRSLQRASGLVEKLRKLLEHHQRIGTRVRGMRYLPRYKKKNKPPYNKFDPYLVMFNIASLSPFSYSHLNL